MRAQALMALALLVAAPSAVAGADPLPLAFPVGGTAQAFPLRGAADAVPLPGGDVLVAEAYGGRVLRVDAAGNVTQFARSGLVRPVGLAVLPGGEVVVSDAGGDRLVRVGADGTVATLARLRGPGCVRVAPDGALLVSQPGRDRVVRILPGGHRTVVAGTGARGFSGDGGSALRARLDDPGCAVQRSDGAVLIADHGNSRLREVGTDGRIRTVAGTGRYRFSGEGRPATASGMNPVDVVLEPDGSVVVADGLTHRVRRIAPDGVVRTVAGTGAARHGGDGGAAATARLDFPARIARTDDGALLVTDSDAQVVRRIGPEGGITTLVGAPQQPGRRPDAVVASAPADSGLEFWQRGGLTSRMVRGRDAAGRSGMLVSARVGAGRPALLVQVGPHYHLRTVRGCWQRLEFIGPLISGGLLGLDLLSAAPQGAPAGEVTLDGAVISRQQVEDGLLETLRAEGTRSLRAVQLWGDGGLTAQWRFTAPAPVRLPDPRPVCALQVEPAVTG